MSDDKTKTGSKDRVRIDLHQDHEVDHWSRKSGITCEQLREAVARAGNRAHASKSS
jgi:hypothetical protein